MRLKYPGTHWIHVLPIVRFLQLQSPTTMPSTATRLQSPLFLTPGSWHPHSACREGTHSDGCRQLHKTTLCTCGGLAANLLSVRPTLLLPHPATQTCIYIHITYIHMYANTHTHTHHTHVHTCIHIHMQIHQHIQLTNADIDISLPFGGVRIVERCTLLTLPPCCVVHAVDTDSPADSARSLVH